MLDKSTQVSDTKATEEQRSILTPFYYSKIIKYNTDTYSIPLSW